MSGPANAVVGELDEPTNIPQSVIPEDQLTEEKKLAKYSKTAEFERLRQYMESRIQFYQTFLPDGRSLTAMEGTDSEIARNWKVANIVISELQAILNDYQRAEEIVTEHEQRR